MIALARVLTVSLAVVLLILLVPGCIDRSGMVNARVPRECGATRCGRELEQPSRCWRELEQPAAAQGASGEGALAGSAAAGGVPIGAALPGDHVLLNLAAMRLQVWVDGLLRGCYPVAIGKPSRPTPAGTYRIVARHLNPTWYPPEGGVPVPPGPDNPLGSRFLALSLPGYGLHGTNAPASIGHAVSRGCVRLSEEHVALLWRWAYVGLPVRIVYRRMVVDPASWGTVLLVWPDPYEREELSTAMVAGAAPWPEEVLPLAREALAWAAEGPVLLVAAAPARAEAVGRLLDEGTGLGGRGLGHEASN